MANDIQYGATLTCNDGASSAQQAWTPLKGMTPPAQVVSDIKVTSLGSTARTHEYIGGMIEPGELTFEVGFTATNYTRATGLKGSAKTWVITFNTSTTVTFSGYVGDVQAPLDNPDEWSTITVKVKVTGPHTIS